MTLRKGFLLLHLVGGLISAVFLFILGLTGAVLVFEGEIDHWLNPNLAWVKPQEKPLPLNTLAELVEKRHDGSKTTTLVIPGDERLSVTMSLRSPLQKGTISVAVNPYTGAELGTLDGANPMMKKVHQFHTNLLLGPPGKQVTAYSACVLLGLSITGLVLWWPRKLWKLSRSKSGRLVNFELHNALGLYSSIFMLLFAVTGMVIHWDDELRTLINRGAHAEDSPIPKGISAPSSGRQQSPDEILALAQEIVPGARVTVMQGLNGNNPIRITMKFPEDSTPAGRTNLYLDPFSGEVLSKQTSRTAPLGTRIVKLWNREIHTGDIGGWPTRILACIASLSLPVLAISGPLIWLGRIRRRDR